jgi:hypothetical protein
MLETGSAKSSDAVISIINTSSVDEGEDSSPCCGRIYKWDVWYPSHESFIFYMICEILTAVLLMIQAFWVVSLGELFLMVCRIQVPSYFLWTA